MSALPLSALSVVVALAVCEVGVRFVRPFEPLIDHPVFNHIWQPLSTIHHGEAVNRGQSPYSRSTDSLGWLTREELSENPAPNEYRIFFLGDSFTEGTVPEEESMPFLVGQELVRMGNLRQLKVVPVNVGTSSHSPILHFLRYREELRRYHPKALIISVDMTDAFDDGLYEPSCSFNESGILMGCPARSSYALRHERIDRGIREVRGIEYFVALLSRWSELMERVRIQVWKSRHYWDEPDPQFPTVFEWCTSPSSNSSATARIRTRGYIEKLVQLARNDGVAVFVTAVPHKQHFTSEWSHQPFSVIKEGAEAAGGIYLDSFTPLFKKYGRSGAELLYFSNDMHFNRQGYAEWSKVLNAGIISVPDWPSTPAR